MTAPATILQLPRPPATEDERASRRLPADQLQRHVILNRDAETKTGVCRKCGPVSLMKVSGVLRCSSVGKGVRARHLRDRYGITIEEYDRRYAEQGGRCRLCQQEHPLLHVDHCHESQAVRGLLCGDCNRGLGLFKDDVETLQRAIEYLR